MMSEIRYEDAPAELLNRVPEFADVFQQHIEENGEILPYVLFGASLREFVLDSYRDSIGEKEHPINAKDILQRTVSFIEYCTESEDERVVTLITVGFLETLNNLESYTKPILEILGPETRRLYTQLEVGWAEFERRRPSSD